MKYLLLLLLLSGCTVHTQPRLLVHGPQSLCLFLCITTQETAGTQEQVNAGASSSVSTQNSTELSAGGPVLAKPPAPVKPAGAPNG